jgi:hypothetical protein
MKPERVLEIVAQQLANELGHVWVHPPDAQQFGKLNHPAHHISIGGWYPEILGLRDGDHVVAVVVRGGDDSYLAALGQAVAFRRGAHFVLLAGEIAPLRQVRDAAFECGIGVIGVGPDERADIQFGAASGLPPMNDVRRELAVLERRTVRRRFTSLIFNHPVHFLAPIMAIRPETPQPKQEVAGLLMERWGFTGPRTEAWYACLYGALFLGLVKEDARNEELLGLTELGTHVRNALLDRYSAADLRELANKKKPLIDLAPDVALLLRSLFLGEPDVALLLGLLETMEPTGVGIEKLVLRMLQVAPNAAINLFFRNEVHERVLELVRGARYRDLFDPAFARASLLPSVFGGFKAQLVHLGFLRAECPLWAEPERYDPGEDLWIRR